MVAISLKKRNLFLYRVILPLQTTFEVKTSALAKDDQYLSNSFGPQHPFPLHREPQNHTSTQIFTQEKNAPRRFYSGHHYILNEDCYEQPIIKAIQALSLGKGPYWHIQKCRHSFTAYATCLLQNGFNVFSNVSPSDRAEIYDPPKSHTVFSWDSGNRFIGVSGWKARGEKMTDRIARKKKLKDMGVNEKRLKYKSNERINKSSLYQ